MSLRRQLNLACRAAAASTGAIVNLHEDRLEVKSRVGGQEHVTIVRAAPLDADAALESWLAGFVAGVAHGRAEQGQISPSTVGSLRPVPIKKVI